MSENDIESVIEYDGDKDERTIIFSWDGTIQDSWDFKVALSCLSKP
jgi:hypothetical protein